MGIIIDDDGVMHKVFTKDEVMAMLEELLFETEKLDCEIGHNFEDYYNVVVACQKCIQQKIIALKGDLV